MTDTFKSTEDRRTDNTLRHKYRVLSDDEKAAMDELKDAGLAFFDIVDRLGTGREYSLAKTKMEEAVMWAVKGLTK